MSYFARWTRRFVRCDAGSQTAARTNCASAATAALLLLVSASQVGLQAAPPGLSLGDAASQRKAIGAIPFELLTEPVQAKLRPVVSQPSIYRHLPVTVIQSDPDLYLFLVRYPEVVVNIWDLMGITKVSVQRTGNYTFEAQDGAGTVTQVELVYGDRNTHVFYAEGQYEGPLLRRLIRGRCVLVLQSDYVRTADDRVYITNEFDMFVQFDNVGAEVLAKTLHPLVGRSADHNFVESTRFLGQVSQAAETRAAKIQQLASRLTKTDPAVREQFAALVAAVHDRSAMRNGGQIAGGSESDDVPDPDSAALTTRPATAAEGANLLFLPEPTRKPLRLRR